MEREPLQLEHILENGVIDQAMFIFEEFELQLGQKVAYTEADRVLAMDLVDHLTRLMDTHLENKRLLNRIMNVCFDLLERYQHLLD
jgi:hypothetical protein